MKNCKIKKIVNLSGFKIFEDATVENIIIILQKDLNPLSRGKNKIKVIIPSEEPSMLRMVREKVKEIPQYTYEKMPDNLFRLDVDSDKLKLKKKIETGSIFLQQICYVNWGARSGDIKTFVVREKKGSLYKPMLDGRDIDRYRLRWAEKYLIYDKNKLYNPMFEELFENEKLIIRDVNAREGIKATFDDQCYYTEHTVSLCLLYYQLANVKRRGLRLCRENIELSKEFNLKYILAVLNSKLISFYFKTFIGCGLHVYPDNIRALPIKVLSMSEQQIVVELVDKMLSLNKQLVSLGNKQTDERVNIEKQIKETDFEIDELIYKIYELTADEKKIVENSLK